MDPLVYRVYYVEEKQHCIPGWSRDTDPGTTGATGQACACDPQGAGSKSGVSKLSLFGAKCEHLGRPCVCSILYVGEQKQQQVMHK